jgi:hypothetical protein
MAFTDFAKLNASFVSGHAVGEQIDFRAWPGTLWITIAAVVNRQPVDELGQFLRNTVLVFISKALVDAVVPTKDVLRLTVDKRPGEQSPTYLVKSSREQPGHWVLTCERKP